MRRLPAILAVVCLVLCAATTLRAGDSAGSDRLGHSVDSYGRPSYLFWWTEGDVCGTIYRNFFLVTRWAETDGPFLSFSEDDSKEVVYTKYQGPGRKRPPANKPGTITEDIDPQGKAADPPPVQNRP